MLDFLRRPATIRFRDEPTLASTPARKRRGTRRTVLRVDGRSHGVLVREHARTRRLTLRLRPQSRGDDEPLVVTVPPGTAMGEIDAFLRRHEGWAREQLAGRPPRVPLADGATIPLRGRPTRIVHAGAGRGPVRLGEEDGEPVLFVRGEAARVERRVTDWLKREARADLEAAVARHAAALGVRPRSITVRDTVSRWGSCSTTGALNFSWRIVLAPPQVLDYLAAHEVAHLQEMNHGPRFWALVERLHPGMNAPRRWLKENGATLHAVG